MSIQIQLLLLIFILAIIVQLVFWLIAFGKILFWKSKSKRNAEDSEISLVVCSKNNKEEISQSIPYFIDQRPSTTEMVIVDDFSIDDTKNHLEALSKSVKNLVVVQAKTDIPGKKSALLTGISASTGKVLLLTDSDCHPKPKWSYLMAAQLRDAKKIVLGYAPFYEKPGFLNKWARYECVLTALQYLSFALWGRPYMGVGRNLMYTRAVFDEKQNLEDHMDIASGDDDLLISAMATGQNTAICLDKESFVYSAAAESWQKYTAQKKRHYSTSTSYRGLIKIILSLFSFTHLLFYLGVLGFFYFFGWKYALAFYLIRIIPIWIMNFKLFNLLEVRTIWAYWPLLDLLLNFYYIYFSVFVLFPKKQQWN